MKKESMQRRGLVPLALAGLCALFSAGSALAGPVEDFAQAEKLFATGEILDAMDLYTKAAEAGHAAAQARVGTVLDKSEEDDLAFSWFGKSAAQGNADGQYGLALMVGKGEGTGQDYEQALKLLAAAAGQGHQQATMAIMAAYRDGGMGLKADPVQYQAWLAKLKALMPEYKPAPAVLSKEKVVRRRGERK